MIKTRVFCDFCDRPIALQYSDETHTEAYVNLSKTKVHDTRDMFPHLCESCAARIDMVLLKYKADMKKQTELAEKFAKANAERRDRLGTEG